MTTQSLGAATVTKVDADGDTVMTPTRMHAHRKKAFGDRKSSGGKQRAK